MSAVDVNSIRKGDAVSVRGEIREIVRTTMGTSFRVALDGNSNTDQWVAGSTIISVEPRPLAVGDSVTGLGDMRAHEIVAIADGNAWIKLKASDDKGFVMPLTSLVPA